MTMAAADDLVRQGRTPSRLHNNCSGKHAGFLTTAAHLREPLVGYAGEVHPAQLRVKRVLAQLADAPVDTITPAVDGCGVPTFALPVRGLALAAARFAAPAALGRLRAEAAGRILAAMTAHPELIGGDGRFDTRIIAAAGGSVVTKGGAEAVHIAICPSAGLGIALKMDDGAGRAAECVMGALLLRYTSPAPALADVLRGSADAPIRNATGARVGAIRPAASLGG